VRNRAAGHIEEAEVDFVLFKNVLITAHYGLVDPLNDFAKIFEMDSMLSRGGGINHADFCFSLRFANCITHSLSS